MSSWSELGSASLGVWRRREALEHRTRSQVHAHVAQGEWQRPFPGVYTDGGTVLSAEQWAIAAVFASTRADPDAAPSAVAAVRTAARVWGMPLIDDDDPTTGARETRIHQVVVNRSVQGGERSSVVVTPTRYQPVEPSMLLRHRTRLAREEMTQRASGLWLTTPLRTALDCASVLPYEAAVCLLDHCLHTGLVTSAELGEGLASRRGMRGCRPLAAAVAAADARAESAAETLARLLLLPALPGLVPQVPLHDRGGNVIARFDLGDAEVKLAVETDGKRFHAGDHMVAKDRRRDRRTEARGWWTERVTWFDLRRRSAEVVARVTTKHRHLAQRSTAALGGRE